MNNINALAMGDMPISKRQIDTKIVWWKVKMLIYLLFCFFYNLLFAALSFM